MKRHIAHPTPAISPERQERAPRELQPRQPNLRPGKSTEQILTKTTSSCTKDKKVIGKRQHRFTKGKLCRTNLIAFDSETTIHLNERRAVSVVHLNLSKLFPTVSHSNLVAKWLRYGLDKWKIRWVNAWLGYWA